jgi:hypothetical protein
LALLGGHRARAAQRRGLKVNFQSRRWA